MMKWSFKVLSEQPTLQGFLRTRTTALYHPGTGREKRAKEKGEENARDSEQEGEHSNAKES